MRRRLYKKALPEGPVVANAKHHFGLPGADLHKREDSSNVDCTKSKGPYTITLFGDL